MNQKGVLLNDLVANEMLLDNALDDWWRGGAIPDSIRVDNYDRAGYANSQAVSLGAEDASGARIGGFVEFQLF